MKSFKIKLILSALLLFNLALFGQDYYVNKLIENTNNHRRQAVVHSNFEREKLILVYSNTIINLESGFFLFSINDEGKILDSMWIVKDSMFLFTGGLYTLSDTTYFVGGSWVDNPNDRSFPFIFQIDFKNKMYEYFTYESDHYIAPRRYIKTVGGDFVATGYSLKNGYSQFYLAKFGAEGDLLWEKEYGSQGWQDAHSVVELPDGGFAIGGWKRRGVEFKQDHYVVRTDSAGNFLWQKIFGGEDNGIAILSLKSTGNLIVSSDRNKTHNSFDAALYELDNNNGNVLWFETYEQEWNNSFITPAIILDGDTMVVGGYRGIVNADSTRTWRHATLTKLDPRGNIIWDRMFYYEKDNNHYLEGRGLVQDNEGNFWAYGQMNPHGWLIKLDSMGCPYPDCDSITVSASEVVSDEQFQFITVPNPVTDQLRVYYRFVQPVQRPRIEIIDIQGKVRDRIPLNGHAPEGDVWIQCSHWPVGIYLIQLVIEDRVMGVRKVVVQR